MEPRHVRAHPRRPGRHPHHRNPQPPPRACTTARHSTRMGLCPSSSHPQRLNRIIDVQDSQHCPRDLPIPITTAWTGRPSWCCSARCSPVRRTPSRKALVPEQATTVNYPPSLGRIRRLRFTKRSAGSTSMIASNPATPILSGPRKTAQKTPSGRVPGIWSPTSCRVPPWNAMTVHRVAHTAVGHRGPLRRRAAPSPPHRNSTKRNRPAGWAGPMP